MIGYITFKNNTIMIFDTNVPKRFISKKMENEIQSYGIVKTDKWVCYDNDGKRDIESTMILRLTLSV